MSNFHSMVDNTFALMADNAASIGDHFGRTNTDRESVLAWCSAARRELAEELAPFPIGQEVKATLDAIDRVLDVVEVRSLQAN
jgi:hypothetical protein